jgi:hypothetical protein
VSLELFDQDPTTEILQVTWRADVPGNEPRIRLLKIRGLGLLTRRRTNPIPNECKRGGHIRSSKKLRFHLGSIKPMRKIKSRGQTSSMSRIWRMSQQHGGAIWRGEHACGDKFRGAERR